MPLLNSAESIFLGYENVDAIFVGTTLAWPPAQGAQPVITNISTLGTLTVSWNPVENATSYELRRNGVLITTTALITYSDSGLNWNTSYTYTIVPIVFGVKGDESIPSVPVYINAPIGTKPTISSVSSAGSLVLSWAAVTNASSYKVYRNGTLIVTTASRTYTDTGLAWNSSYSYTTVPVVGGKDGVASAATSSGAIPVSAVGALSASSKTYTNVTVSWSAVLGATSYYVYVNGVLKSTLSGLSYSISTSEDTTITVYVRPVRNGVSGTSSSTYHYYSGRAEQRDIGSKTGMVFSPVKVDSWRSVDDWAWLSNIAAQGYFTSSYGSYRGVCYYGSSGVRDSLRSTLGTNGTARQLNGTCTKAELYLYKKTGVGSYGSVDTTIYRTNSTASGDAPSGTGGVTRATAVSGEGSWINVGTAHGQAVGDGSYKSLMVRNDGSSNYAQFTDCRLRLSWSWNYVTVTAQANSWYL